MDLSQAHRLEFEYIQVSFFCFSFRYDVNNYKFVCCNILNSKTKLG